jgi:uncharacterized damage-inducible protein DinB
MTKKNISALLVVLSMSLTAAPCFSQPTIPADSIKSMLIKDWQRGKAYTGDYMKAMPAGEYSFRATDSVKSFAQQLLHITEATMWLVSTATGEKMPDLGSNVEKRMSAQSADSVVYYVNSSYDFAVKAIKKLSPTSLMESVTVNMGGAITATRLGWLLKAFEHQTHHRGQTTVYLRLSGIRPPDERLF